MTIEVNIFAVFFAAIASMIVGFLWYSPILFAKPWMKLMGYTQKGMDEERKGMEKLYALSFVAALVTAYILSHVMVLSVSFYSDPWVITGVTTAFWLWLGFIMPVQLTDTIFGSKKWQLFAINTGYQLASILAMGVVLGLF
ncbi:MAG: DUF1761 domain-containing protein [Patescibacteria group bacterium]